MANPFPGIDPYLESQHYWEDFHSAFLIYMRDAINDRLPEGYGAKVEERFTIASFREEGDVRPDLAVLRDESAPPRREGGAVAVMTEPEVIPLPLLIGEETTQAAGSRSAAGRTARSWRSSSCSRPRTRSATAGSPT